MAFVTVILSVKNDFFALYGPLFLPPGNQDTKDFEDYSNKFYFSACVSVWQRQIR